jgi:cation transport ATPase
LLAGCNKEDQQNIQKAAENAAEQTKNTVSDGFEAANEKATAAMKSVEGGPEMLSGLTQTFEGAEKAVKGIKDTETAKEAGATIDQLDEKLDGLIASSDKWPAEAKTAIANLSESGLAKLKELIEKVKSIPEVETVIKPKLDAISAKIKSLTSNETKEP